MGELQNPKTLTELQSVLTENDGVVVTFTQPRTCAPCRAFKPHLEKAAAQNEDVVFAVVNLDNVPDAISEYEIRGVPTVQLYRNGELVRDIKSRTVIPLLAEIGA